MVIDLVCLELSYVCAYLIRHGVKNPFSDDIYKNMFFIMFFLQVTVVFFFDTFKNVLKRGYYKEFCAALKQGALVVLFSSFYLYITHEAEGYSRTTFLLTGPLYVISAYSTRCMFKRYLKEETQTERGNRSLLIVTVKSALNTIVNNIKNNNYEGFRLAGVVLIDEDLAGQTIDGIDVVANYDTAADYVCREWIDEVFVDLPEKHPVCEDLVEKFTEMGVTVHRKLAEVKNQPGQKQFVEQLGTYTVLTTSVNIAAARDLFLKRLMDICGGLAGCLLTGILFIFVGPAIYIQSPGPIFFSQIRVGKNGKKFKMYKFRSMYMDAEQRKEEVMKNNRVAGGFMYKLDYDPRIIGSEKGQNKGIGNFIRKTSIDEFPQFLNILKGDMSLVGTRPPTVDEWEKYELHHRARLAIKPGLTGMWQVSGRSDITDFEEVVKLDREYIENWSIGLDIKMLIKTVLVVLKGQGSM